MEKENTAQIQTHQVRGQENKAHLNKRVTEQIFMEND